MIEKSSSCIVKIDLTDMDAEMRSPKVQSLLHSGYEITSSVPVSDEGRPSLLLVMQQKSGKKEEKTSLFILVVLIITMVLKAYEVFN